MRTATPEGSLQMSQITTGDPRAARGRQRQTELAAEMKQAVATNSAIMLRGLGRPHTLAEAFVAEAICALFLRARRLRDSGRDDVALLTEAARLQQGSVFAALAPWARPLPLIDPPTPAASPE
jgi:hypothetical protein